MKQLNDYIDFFAQKKPIDPFIIHGDYHLTFKDASSQIQSLTNKLINTGVRSGQTVGILLQNCPEFIISYLAILNTGAIAALLPWTVSKDEVATLATTTRIDTLIYSGHFQEYADSICDLCGKPIKCFVLDGETDHCTENLRDCLNIRGRTKYKLPTKDKNSAVILFSAGDYTHPKSLVFTHDSLPETAASSIERFPKNYKFRLYTSLPYFHYFPFSLVINLAIVSGSTIIIPVDDSREALYSSIYDHKVNTFISNSGFIKELTGDKHLEPEKLNSIDFYIPAGDSFSIKTKDIIYRRYGAMVMEAYGVAEAPVITMNLNSNKNISLSVGKPLSCCEILIVDENGNEVADGQPGNLMVRGKNVFHHYFDQYRGNGRDPDVWIDTGDIARRDSEGFLYWESKQSDRFYRKGFQVPQKNILDVVIQHPNIREATILQSNDSKLHNQIQLAVTLFEDESLDKEELLKFCKEKLPKYLVPDDITVFDHFERSCIGVIKKSQLHQNEKVRK
ncbi:MAG: acyl--CoA ligase [Candidatus Marinimicrobia bacterium]|nr:acyl--CoA ligase [Candidatus Neomarinimicrobiota bacterium]